MYGLRVMSHVMSRGSVRLLVPNSSRNLKKYQSLLCSRAISTTCTLCEDSPRDPREELEYRRAVEGSFADRERDRDMYSRNMRDDLYHRRDMERGQYYTTRRPDPYWERFKMDMERDRYYRDIQYRDAHQRDAELRRIAELILLRDVAQKPGNNEQQKSVARQPRRQRQQQRKLNRPPVKETTLAGHFAVHDALKAAKRTFHRIYVSDKKMDSPVYQKLLEETLVWAKERNIPVEYRPSQEMRSVRGDHRGIMADVSDLTLEEFKYTDEDAGTEVQGEVEGHPPKLWLVVCGNRDAVGLANMIHTACTLGVDKIITHECAEINSMVSTRSFGLVDFADIYKTENFTEFIQESKARGKHVFGYINKKLGNQDAEGGTMTVESTPIHEAKLTKDSILLFHPIGLSEDVLALCDDKVEIQRKSCHFAENIPLKTVAAMGILLNTLLSPKQQSNQ